MWEIDYLENTGSVNYEDIPHVYTYYTINIKSLSLLSPLILSVKSKYWETVKLKKVDVF